MASWRTRAAAKASSTAAGSCPSLTQTWPPAFRDALFAADALLLGRVTYQHFAAAWPSMTDEEGFAERMNTLPKYVASTTLQEPLAWNATLLHGAVPAPVAKLKQQPAGDLLVQGSGALVGTLMQHNLVDTYQLWVHPAVLGSGKRLFADGVAPTPLRLVDTRTTTTGVVRLTYQAARTTGEG